MSASETFLQICVYIALGLLSVSFLVTVFKVVKGPTLPDRVLALDMLVAVAIGFIAVLAIKTGFTLYIDIAIALGLVGFLATVAFARFILARGKTEELVAPQNVAGPNIPASTLLNRVTLEGPGDTATATLGTAKKASAKRKPSTSRKDKAS